MAETTVQDCEIAGERSLRAISEALPPTLRQRIVELSNLKANWDGEGATQIKPHILSEVVEALMRLAQHHPGSDTGSLIPTFDGYVQMEWHCEKRSLEIEAVSHGWATVGSTVDASGKHEYFVGECKRGDFPQLERFY